MCERGEAADAGREEIAAVAKMEFVIGRALARARAQDSCLPGERGCGFSPRVSRGNPLCLSLLAVSDAPANYS